MQLKHLLPYDNCVIEGPISADEATARMKAHTGYIQPGLPRPDAKAFDGWVGAREFDVTLWPERQWRFWRSRAIDGRNMARPVCRGKIVNGSRGCQVKVSLRPRSLHLVLIALFMIAAIGAIADAGFGSRQVPAIWFNAMVGVATVYVYVATTVRFWRWRDRTISALVKVLRE